jgi:Ni/Fe-hydrogenase subunit HybB-like protein
MKLPEKKTTIRKGATIMKNNFLKFTFWKVVGVIIIVAGLYSTYIRFTKGLGASTNLSDAFPWGIWIGFDMLCGVGLAAGGFTLCAVTHIFNIEKFKPLTRSAILTAFLGYILAVCGLMFDLGRPWAIWHAIIMWNPHSVMFEVAWCVMLYSTVLFLEFFPVVLEKYKLGKLLKIMKRVAIPIMMLGILLSTLHQSSLGSLYLIMPEKMHPLWYSPLLPVYFYLSAISAGFAMVIFESYLSARAFNHGLKLKLLSTCGLISLIFILVNFALKIVYLTLSGKLQYLMVPSSTTYLFYLEILLGTIVPAFFLSSKKFRDNRKYLYFSSLFVIAGFLLNRMNVSVTSLAAMSTASYFPSVYEISVTLMLCTIGMWAFKFITANFPVFEEEHEEEKSKLVLAPNSKPLTISELK